MGLLIDLSRWKDGSWKTERVCKPSAVLWSVARTQRVKDGCLFSDLIDRHSKKGDQIRFVVSRLMSHFERVGVEFGRIVRSTSLEREEGGPGLSRGRQNGECVKRNVRLCADFLKRPGSPKKKGRGEGLTFQGR